MSSVHPQPLEPSSILKISEDGDHVTKGRSSSASCDCCHKRYVRCNFRVWKFLLLLFAILVIVSKMAVLAAIFGPGKATLEEDYTGIRNWMSHLKMSDFFKVTMSGRTITYCETKKLVGTRQNQNYHLTIVCVHMLDSIPKHMYLFGICLFVIVIIFLILLLLVSI